MEVNKKNALVIGCGSIGSKYINLLIDLGFKVGCYDNKKIDKKLFNDNVIFFDTLESSLNINPNIIIISTPPNSHLSCLKSVSQSKAKILIEKPLASSHTDAQKILEIANENQKRIWCVANMRYHPGFKAIQKNLGRLGKIYSVTSHFTHRLSQMRSVATNVFASNKDEGGVILDCVHDIDLLNKLFGKLSLVNSRIANLGDEKIEAEDYADLWLESESKIHISMHLDFLSCWKSRGIKIIAKNATLFWESYGKNPEITCVSVYDSDGVNKLILNNITVPKDLVYREMLIDFINQCKNLQTVQEASDILKIALKARL